MVLKIINKILVNIERKLFVVNWHIFRALINYYKILLHTFNIVVYEITSTAISSALKN